MPRWTGAEHGDVLSQAGLLGMLHMFHFRGGDFNTALHHAKHCRAVAGTIEDPAATALAHSILGRSRDLRSAEEHIDACISLAESYSLGPLMAVGRGRQGELAIRRGDASDGLEGLRASLGNIHAARYELLNTEFNISLAQGLAAIRRPAEAITLIDETLRRVETNGDVVYVPELLRVKGGLLLSMPRPSVEGAKRCFMQSLELSRRQGARAWELRTAVDLATLLADQGRRENGRALLQPVFEQFVEGRDTADLKAAERVLSNLG
jgi:tetratricopeptide (TPR) repeat protein